MIFFFINTLSNCVCRFDAFEHNKHIPKHNLNEKDNIIKPKKKFKQLKNSAAPSGKATNKFQPTEKDYAVLECRWLIPYTTNVKVQLELSLPTTILNYNLSQSLQIKTKIS